MKGKEFEKCRRFRFLSYDVFSEIKDSGPRPVSVVVIS